MPTRSWIRDEVRRLRRDIASGSIELDPDAKRLAEQYALLPIASQWTGWHLLDERGRVLYWDENPGDAPPTVEKDPRWRLEALMRGARRFPSLQVLLPERPKDARECTVCRGIGWLVPNETSGVRPAPDGNTPGSLGCSDCLTLGWVTRAGKSADTIEADRRRSLWMMIGPGIVGGLIAVLITQCQAT